MLILFSGDTKLILLWKKIYHLSDKVRNTHLIWLFKKIDFVAEKNYIQARYHLLHSEDGKNCALMLVECHVNNGYPSEVDLFIAQAVLQ